MGVIWLATIALVCFATWFMKVRCKGHSKTDVVLKAICSACLLVIAGWALHINMLLKGEFSYMGFLIFLGGLVGDEGDLFLGLSHLNKETKRRNMLTGIIGFGVGHVLYCLAVILKYRENATAVALAIPVVIGLVLAISVGVFRRNMGLHFGRYLPAVVTYVFLLTFSVALSVSLNIATNWESRQLNLFGLGMILFIVSDVILSGMYFGKMANSPRAVITNHATYYAAQWLIAFSILFV